MAEPIATAVAAKVFSDVVSKLATTLFDATGGKLQSLLTAHGSSLRSHLSHTFERCTKIKTLLNRDEPTNLLSLYVNQKFKCETQIIDDFDLIEQIHTRKRVIVTGTGGSGKSMFMKYLWIALFENPQGKIPVFLELRRMSEVTADRLDNYVYQSIIDTPSTLARKHFDRAVGNGTFVLVLDGFDEIVADKREALERQILEWSHRNPLMTIVVSGRPDDRFSAWQLFSTFDVRPFEKKQTVDLVNKLTFDPIIRKKFVERIKQGLFERHQTFLSNPLLATMMLLTFDQFADIPEKIHIFYEQAFDTLFSKHDATKEAYKRKMHSNCSIDVFKKYLSYFCLSSYYEEKFEFTETEVLAILKEVLKIDDSTIDSQDFFRDLVESVCMLRRDGFAYTFAHRSFQEFFAAYCLARVNGELTAEVLEKIGGRYTDKAPTILFEMNRDLVETRFVIPKLKEFCALIGMPSNSQFIQNYCSLTTRSIRILDGPKTLPFHFYMFPTDWGNFVNLLYKLYPIMNFSKAHVDEWNRMDRLLIARHLGKRRKRGHRLSVTFDLDEFDNVSLSAWNMEKSRLPQANDRDSADIVFTEPAPWFYETGFVKRCEMEASKVLQLLNEIEMKRGSKSKAIHDLLKLR